MNQFTKANSTSYIRFWPKYTAQIVEEKFREKNRTTAFTNLNLFEWMWSCFRGICTFQRNDNAKPKRKGSRFHLISFLFVLLIRKSIYTKLGTYCQPVTPNPLQKHWNPIFTRRFDPIVKHNYFFFFEKIDDLFWWHDSGMGCKVWTTFLWRSTLRRHLTHLDFTLSTLTRTILSFILNSILHYVIQMEFVPYSGSNITVVIVDA